jgi:hypothetical protein
LNVKISFIAIFSLIAVCGLAQSTPGKVKTSWEYTGIIQGGLIGGSAELNYSAQTIQGIQKGPWLVGIGAGIDNYVAPGFPIVAHGQYNYGKRRSQPFAYLQAGPQIPWLKNEWDDKFDDENIYDVKTGWLAEGGLGYRFPMGKRLKLISSIGYSIKQVQYDEKRINWWGAPIMPRPGENPWSVYQQKLTMNRLILKVGVQF